MFTEPIRIFIMNQFVNVVRHCSNCIDACVTLCSCKSFFISLGANGKWPQYIQLLFIKCNVVFKWWTRGTKIFSSIQIHEEGTWRGKYCQPVKPCANCFIGWYSKASVYFWVYSFGTKSRVKTIMFMCASLGLNLHILSLKANMLLFLFYTKLCNIYVIFILCYISCRLKKLSILCVILNLDCIVWQLAIISVKLLSHPFG